MRQSLEHITKIKDDADSIDIICEIYAILDYFSRVNTMQHKRYKKPIPTADVPSGLQMLQGLARQRSLLTH